MIGNFFACKSVTKHTNMLHIFLNLVKNLIVPLQKTTELQLYLPWLIFTLLINICSSIIHIFPLFPCLSSYARVSFHCSIKVQYFWNHFKWQWNSAGDAPATHISQLNSKAMRKFVHAQLMKTPLWLLPVSLWLFKTTADFRDVRMCGEMCLGISWKLHLCG